MAPSGRQKGSEKGAKRGLGAEVAPSRLWDPILDDLGGSGSRFGEHLGVICESFGSRLRGLGGLLEVLWECVSEESLKRAQTRFGSSFGRF